MRTLGMDVSKWEGLINYPKAISEGIKYVIVKASQWVADPRFAENWKNAKDVGLIRGAYHYLDWGLSEITQAKKFVDTMGGDWGEIPPCLDLEMNPLPYGLNAEQVSGKAWNFVKEVEKLTGRIPMIYVGYYYWNSWGSNNLGWARYPLWLPWYATEAWIKICTKGGTGAPKPWTDWTFWQFTDRADGMKYGCQSLMVDMNWFNGSEDDLKKFISGGSTPPIPPPTNNKYVVAGVPISANVRSSPGGAIVGTVIKGKIVTGYELINGYRRIGINQWVWNAFLEKI